jgi:hypothetical protein
LKKRISENFSISKNNIILCQSHQGTMILTRGVSHCGLAIYIKKYLKAKEELWKFKYFTMQK